MLEGYYIVENSGVVPAEKRFKFKDLKAWGYDLHLGTIEGERAYFVSGIGERKEGEDYTLEGKSYHVTKTQHEIPKLSSLLAWGGRTNLSTSKRRSTSNSQALLGSKEF